MNGRASKNAYESIIIYYFNMISKVISKPAKFVDIIIFLENEMVHE